MVKIKGQLKKRIVEYLKEESLKREKLKKHIPHYNLLFIGGYIQN